MNKEKVRVYKIVFWTSIGIFVTGLLIAIAGVWTDDGRFGATAALICVPAIVSMIITGVNLAEDSDRKERANYRRY